MNLIIGTSNGDNFSVEDFEPNTLLDLKEELDNPELTFLLFELDNKEVLLNKAHIVSIEIE